MTVVRAIGRYVLHEQIGAGGMAAVHLGSLSGPIGFARIVAIKRLHQEYVRDSDVIAKLIDEARLTSRIQHANVVPTLDVVTHEGELFLVMEYVHGASLAALLAAAKARGERIPAATAATIVAHVLHGLHAAHELKGIDGRSLGLVHRDVSPQNIFVGADGIARILDFGVAKAVGQLHVTRHGHIAGKLAYMAPEHARGQATRQSDVFAAGVVLWEALTGCRLFQADTDAETLTRVLECKSAPPSALATDGEHDEITAALDGVVLRALSREPADRFATAQTMAAAIEDAVHLQSITDVAAWVERLVPESLSESSRRVAAVEQWIAQPDRQTTMPPGLVTVEARKEARAPRTSRRLLVSVAWLTAASIAIGIGVFTTQTSSIAKVEPFGPDRSAVAVAQPSVPASPPDQPVASASEGNVMSPAPSMKMPLVRPTAPSSRRSREATPAGCESPSFIDALGRKVFKEECLR